MITTLDIAPITAIGVTLVDGESAERSDSDIDDKRRLYLSLGRIVIGAKEPTYHHRQRENATYF